MRRLWAAFAACLILRSLPVTAQAAPPNNDSIATPRVVTTVPYTNGPYDTTDATTGATDPAFCGSGDGEPDASTVWYRFTPSSSGFFVADTFGSDYDTTLYVGTPDGAGGINVISCDDDSGEDVQSAVAWEATAGTQYLLMAGTCCGEGVVGEAGGGGTLLFHVAQGSPPPTIDLTVAARGKFTKAGLATIRGTIVCTNADDSFVGVSATQRVGRVLIQGEGTSGGFDCDGVAHPWSVEASAENGLLRGGRVTVVAFGEACGELTCSSD